MTANHWQSRCVAANAQSRHFWVLKILGRASCAASSWSKRGSITLHLDAWGLYFPTSKEPSLYLIYLIATKAK